MCTGDLESEKKIKHTRIRTRRSRVESHANGHWGCASSRVPAAGPRSLRPRPTRRHKHRVAIHDGQQQQQRREGTRRNAVRRVVVLTSRTCPYATVLTSRITRWGRRLASTAIVSTGRQKTCRQHTRERADIKNTTDGRRGRTKY